MSNKLSEEEIKQRLIRLVNVEKMYESQKTILISVREENKLLKEKIILLENENKELKSKLIDFEYQLTQMKAIVFGKKRIASKDDDEEPKSPIQRNKDSYKRPIPREDEVTKTITLTLPKSNNKQRIKTFYVEDIPLNLKKLVTKYVITQEKINGIWIGEISIPATTVTIGENLIMLINTLVVEQRLSYSQIQNLLKLLFNFHISQGEIANLIYKESLKLSPMYEQLKLSIQAESSQHLDESGWRTGKEKDFCRSMTGGESNSSLYKLGVSRGKGYAEELLGLDKGGKLNSVLVSDDYGAYRNISNNHQLCWAHLTRKWKDFNSYDKFKEIVKEEYKEIKSIFKELKENLNISKLNYFTQKLKQFSIIKDNDPPPIARIKRTLQKNIPKYLTCLKFPNIHLTNNLAERSLRSLVIKRNISFGSNTQRGADALSITFTVIKELLRTNPNDFWEAYRRVRV